MFRSGKAAVVVAVVPHGFEISQVRIADGVKLCGVSCKQEVEAVRHFLSMTEIAPEAVVRSLGLSLESEGDGDGEGRAWFDDEELSGPRSLR